MKRAHESTVTICVRSAAAAASVAAADVCISHVSLDASSPLLAAMASDLDVHGSDVTIDIEVDDECAVPIMADLLKNRERWTPKKASEYIFKDEASLTTERVVNLFHALDKYDMTWAMEAFYARFVEDIQAGLVEALSIFSAYREHPRITQFLIGMNKVQKKAPITSSQLKMLLLGKGVHCALIVSEKSSKHLNKSEDGYARVNSHVDIICKVPEKYCGTSMLESDDGAIYIPDGYTGSMIRKFCERTRSTNTYGQWLRIILDGASYLCPPKSWLEERTDEEDDEEDGQIYADELYADLDEVCGKIRDDIGAVISSTGETIHRSDAFVFRGWPGVETDSDDDNACNHCEMGQ